jgi:hypothetical protein
MTRRTTDFFSDPCAEPSFVTKEGFAQEPMNEEFNLSICHFDASLREPAEVEANEYKDKSMLGNCQPR